MFTVSYSAYVGYSMLANSDTPVVSSLTYLFTYTGVQDEYV